MDESLGHLRRPRVEALLDAALTHRLTLVIAPVGAGKTDVLRRWSGDVGAVFVPVADLSRDVAALAQRLVERLSLQVPNLPDDLVQVVNAQAGAAGKQTARAGALAGLVCDALGETVRRDLVLVFDDVHVLEDLPGALAFLEHLLLQAPNRVHLVLSGQRRPSLSLERLEESGELAMIGGVDLALDRVEASMWLAARAGRDAVAQVDRILEVTSGWPAVVLAIAHRLRAGGDVPPVATDLAPHARQAVATLPEQDRRLLERARPLGSICADLCEAIGIPDGRRRLAELADAGLFLRPHAMRPEWFELTALALAGIDEAEDHVDREVNHLAASWLFSNWQPDDGLRCLLRAGALDEAAELLQAVGDVMVTHGHAHVVLEGLDQLDAAPWTQRLRGIALHAMGEWDVALEQLEGAAGGSDRIDPSLAWRIGLTHHQRGDLVAADRAYARSDPSLGSLGDHAMAVSWAATVAWLRGERDACTAKADEAFELAVEAGDTRALAAAHTVLALVAAMDGDARANDAHYRRALWYAERAADIMQRIRIQTNRASLHIDRGEYDAALACADAATRLDDLGGFAPFGALALVNRAEALVALGRLEEAQADLESALERYDAIDSGMAGYALADLGHLLLLRGDRAAAQQAFEEALRRQRTDIQGLLPALTGLAVAIAVDDPQSAYDHIAHALDVGESVGAARVQIAAGVVALALGDIDSARLHAWHALTITEAREERAARADTMVLAAAVAADHDEGRRVAREAIRLWGALGSPAGSARADLALAMHSEPDVARDLAKGVRERMQTIGCRLIAHQADVILAELDDIEAPSVLVEVLGRSRLLLRGRPVPASAWQSRKARTLLRLLVARRGRVVPREELSQRLWPDDDPAKTANRLNVALSTLRSVLDPDREHSTDHHVVTTGDGIRLDLDHIEVDALALLSEAEHADACVRKGLLAEAADAYAQAARRHVGEAFGDDPYDDWTAPLREQVRAAHLEALRFLAQHAIHSDDRDGAVRHVLRVLEQDPHDESAHLQLVRLFVQERRHGEARRRYRIYVERMRELGVDPVPFPGWLTRREGHGHDTVVDGIPPRPGDGEWP